GLDPMELRERNFYRPGQGQTTPYGQPVTQAERISTVWHQVQENASLADRRREITAFNAAHPHTKRAIAVTGIKFGISFNLTAFNQGGALVLIYKDGS
ncbi:xanthine dehydrogenase molybdopterin binding subunit, partial [Xylella fastidiosa subsp. multiplex]|nr:xanthine dehydrogenase molybdopterin binding subunit [Xylella fastidiosa subsp. multiplex]